MESPALHRLHPHLPACSVRLACTSFTATCAPAPLPQHHLRTRFDKLAKELLAALPDPGSVASLQLSPQGVVKFFYPVKGNEAAINHNLLKGVPPSSCI